MGREMVTSPGAGEGRSSQVPRLVITRMELVNFKSYAGTKSIGPFHKVRQASSMYAGVVAYLDDGR